MWDRIAAQQRLIQVSEVYRPTEQEQYDRQLTHLRYRLSRALTRTKNSIKGILRRHNLEQECPTKGSFTLAALRWLKVMSLPGLDRQGLDMRLAEYDHYAPQLAEVTTMIEKHAAKSVEVRRIRTMPKPGAYPALALIVECIHPWGVIATAVSHPQQKCRGGNTKVCVGCSQRRFG